MRRVNEEADFSKAGQHSSSDTDNEKPRAERNNGTAGDGTPRKKQRRSATTPSANDRHGYRFDLIPAVLKNLPQWGVWRREYKNGKPENVPYSVTTGQHLSVNDPNSLSSYEAALLAYQRGTGGQWDGLTCVVTQASGLVGLDLDDCIAEDGTLTEDAHAIVTLWGSYLEYSPSRKGLRGFAFGTLPAGKRKVGTREMYDVKAFTVTGWQYPESPNTVEAQDAAIRTIHARFFHTPPRLATPQPECPCGEADPLTDEEVIALATGAKNGARVRALLSGDLCGYASPSEAELALCNHFAFYCGPDSHEQIDRLVRKHFAGFRSKWDEIHYGDGETYGHHTIQEALKDRTEFYHRPLVWHPSRHEPLTEEEEDAITLAQERDPDDDEELPEGAEGFTATEEPEPATEEPEPATEEPEPATDEPEPTTDEPGPATDEPGTATDEPGTATDEPEDTTTEGPGTATDEAGTATGTRRTEYAIPDILWQGIFEKAAEKMKLYTWEVWGGTLGALSARAHRNLHCHYFSDYIFGNSFSLLVNRTGAGKNIVVNIIRALLGEDYKIRTGLNSGPALVPMLTDDPLKAKDGRLQVRGVPLLLLASEWSRLPQMSGIMHSTLQEDLNDLHMRNHPWTQSRSHKNPTGGDVVVTTPALTIVGTTTRKLFHEALTDKAIASGAINRYVVLPGSATFKPYTGTSYRADAALTGLIDHLQAHTFGRGMEIRELYTDAAWQAFEAFQADFLVPLYNTPDTSETLARLHLHLQHVAALYAWQAQSERIELTHFQAAQAVIEMSHRFMLELLGERAKSFEPTKVQEVEAAMEARAIDKIKRTPGITRREFSRQMSKDKGGYAAWMKTLDALLRAGVLHIKQQGKKEGLYVLLGF